MPAEWTLEQYRAEVARWNSTTHWGGCFPVQVIEDEHTETVAPQ